MRQAVAGVAARDVQHEAQVRQHQLARGVEIAVAMKAVRELQLLLAAQHRDAADRVGIRVETAERTGEGQFGGCAGNQCVGYVHRSGGTSSIRDRANISSLGLRVLRLDGVPVRRS